MTSMFGLIAAGMWKPERGSNIADSGTPFYDVYECADGKYVSVAPIETRFFEQLLDRLEIPSARNSPTAGTARSGRALRQTLAGPFSPARATSGARVLEGTDACFAPVLSMGEAPAAPARRGARECSRR